MTGLYPVPWLSAVSALMFCLHMCRNEFLCWFTSAPIFLAITGSLWLSRALSEECLLYITSIQVLWCETAVMWDTRGQPAFAALGSGKEGSKGAENTLSTVGIRHKSSEVDWTSAVVLNLGFRDHAFPEELSLARDTNSTPQINLCLDFQQRSCVWRNHCQIH